MTWREAYRGRLRSLKALDPSGSAYNTQVSAPTSRSHRPAVTALLKAAISLPEDRTTRLALVHAQAQPEPLRLLWGRSARKSKRDE